MTKEEFTKKLVDIGFKTNSSAYVSGFDLDNTHIILIYSGYNKYHYRIIQFRSKDYCNMSDRLKIDSVNTFEAVLHDICSLHDVKIALRFKKLNKLLNK